MNRDNLISVASIVRNDARIIDDFIDDLVTTLDSAYANYEIVLIDNGSTDTTNACIQEVQKRVKNVRLIILSREYSEEISYSAALENCIGDFVILLDPNSDPPSLIPALVEKSLSGFDVVIAEKEENPERSAFDRLASKLFFKLSKFFTGYDVSAGFSKYIVLSRKAVNSITRIKDRSRYIKFLLLEIGFKHTTIPCPKMNRRSIPPRENYFKAFAFAIEVIVSNSEKLIRLASLLGFAAGLLNLFFVLYVIVGFTFFRQYIPQGWTSTHLVSSTMWFLLFCILAIIGEYLARVLRETKKGDLYYISDELNSSVFPADIERKNVI